MHPWLSELYPHAVRSDTHGARVAANASGHGVVEEEYNGTKRVVPEDPADEDIDMFARMLEGLRGKWDAQGLGTGENSLTSVRG